MCKYCEQKLNLTDDGCSKYYENYENQIQIADGGWTSLYIGVNQDGKIVLRACGDNYTNDCEINYCPFCGRKLKGEKNEKDN